MKLINADALKEWVEKKEEKKWMLSTDEIWNAIENAPAIDPVKHGKWIIEHDWAIMHCSVCRWTYEYYAWLEEEWDYCPHCGAYLRGEK